MDKTRITQCLKELLETSLTDLFRHLDCDINPLNAQDLELGDCPVACIDAGSEDLEVTLLLKVPMSVLGLTYPDQYDIMAATDEQIEDWISELSNQLVGRFKNKLLQHECRLTLGLPKRYYGVDSQEVLPSTADEYISYLYEVDGEPIECNLVIEYLNDDVAFALDVQESKDSIGEGELELF